jgi:hypothetical protein
MSDLREIIRQEYIKCAQDPVYFLKKYCKISHPQRGKIPFHLYPFQEKVVKLFQNHHYSLVLKSRQLGISTLAAGYALWLMLFHSDKNVLCIATKQSTAKNMVTKVRYMYDNLPSWLKIPKEENNKLTLRLNNGSQIIATASSTDSGRSEAVSLLIIDEAAFISNIDEIWASAQQTLATGGGCIAMSTPYGTGNWFHKNWQLAEEGGDRSQFLPIKLPWFVHPERDQKWRDEQDIKLGDPRIAAQECDCDFSTSGDGVFFPEHLKFYEETHIEPPLFKRGADQNLWVWESPDYSRDYMVVADVARGDNKDYSTFHVIDTESNTQVAEYKGHIGTTDFGNLLVGIATEYNEALLIIENNNMGWATVQVAIDRGYRNLYYSPKNDTLDVNSYFDKYMDKSNMVAGWVTSSKNRPKIIGKFQEYISDRGVTIKSRRLWEEMKVFVWKNGRAEAQQGYNDDLVMPFCIGMYIRDTALILRQRGIDLTKSALNNMQVGKPSYSGGYFTNGQDNPYSMKVNGKDESLRWMLPNNRQ